MLKEFAEFYYLNNEIKTVMGFDFGMRHIGVALGQVCTATAQPYATLSACNGQPNWNEIGDLLKQWLPDAAVVGVPVDLDGREYEMTALSRIFLTELAKRFALPVFEAEERLTSVEARARLFEMGGYKALRKPSIDSLAAQLILEGWLLNNVVS